MYVYRYIYMRTFYLSFLFFVTSKIASKMKQLILVYDTYGWTLIQSTRWRHQMETFSALLAICAGNSPVPVNSPHKGQWRGTLMFSLFYARINGWANTGEAGNLRRHHTHYDVIVMIVHVCAWFYIYLGNRKQNLLNDNCFGYRLGIPGCTQLAKAE